MFDPLVLWPLRDRYDHVETSPTVTSTVPPVGGATDTGPPRYLHSYDTDRGNALFQIEYQGEHHEASTLNAALDWATQLVADAPQRLDATDVEHDELTNTWYVQGVIDGQKVGSTAIVSEPDTGVPSDASLTSTRAASALSVARHLVHDDVEFDGWTRLVVISGTTPADAFKKVAQWLARMQSSVQISAVRSVNRQRDPHFALEVYFIDLSED